MLLAATSRRRGWGSCDAGGGGGELELECFTADVVLSISSTVTTPTPGHSSLHQSQPDLLLAARKVLIRFCEKNLVGRNLTM